MKQGVLNQEKNYKAILIPIPFCLFTNSKTGNCRPKVCRTLYDCDPTHSKCGSKYILG